MMFLKDNPAVMYELRFSENIKNKIQNLSEKEVHLVKKQVLILKNFPRLSREMENGITREIIVKISQRKSILMAYYIDEEKKMIVFLDLKSNFEEHYDDVNL